MPGLNSAAMDERKPTPDHRLTADEPTSPYSWRYTVGSKPPSRPVRVAGTTGPWSVYMTSDVPIDRGTVLICYFCPNQRNPINSTNPNEPRHGLAVGTQPILLTIFDARYTLVMLYHPLPRVVAKTWSGPQPGSSTAKASSRPSLPVKMNSRLTKFPGPNAGQTRRYRPLARVGHSENATFICGSAEETRWQPEGNYPRLTADAVCWLIPGGIDEALVERDEMNENTPGDGRPAKRGGYFWGRTEPRHASRAWERGGHSEGQGDERIGLFDWRSIDGMTGTEPGV